MAETVFHQYYKRVNGEIVMVPKPEPEPNWRSLYEELEKRWQIADSRATDINVRNLELASERNEWRKRCQLAEVFIDQLYEQSHDDNLDWLIAEYKNERTKQFG